MNDTHWWKTCPCLFVVVWLMRTASGGLRASSAFLIKPSHFSNFHISPFRVFEPIRSTNAHDLNHHLIDPNNSTDLADVFQLLLEPIKLYNMLLGNLHWVPGHVTCKMNQKLAVVVATGRHFSSRLKIQQESSCRKNTPYVWKRQLSVDNQHLVMRCLKNDVINANRSLFFCDKRNWHVWRLMTFFSQ